MERNIALAIAAGELVGSPFRLQGRDPAHGLDCIGLVLVSLARIGIELHENGWFFAGRLGHRGDSEPIKK